MKCPVCDVEISGRDKWDKNKKKYCGKQCYWKSLIGKLPKSPPPHKPVRFGKCGSCNVTYRLRRKTSKYCSVLCSNIGYSTNTPKTFCFICGNKKENSRKKFCSVKCFGIGTRGPLSPSWKGGIRKENDRRKSFEGVQWRKSVFERDSYTCVLCGIYGGYLEADHIKSYARHPELRYDISNGRTLCRECHKKTPNYGAKAIKDT